MKKVTHLVMLGCVFTALIFVISCKSSKTKENVVDNSVTIRIRSMNNIKIQNSQASLVLYGYDTSMAGAKASVIALKTISITKIPMDVVMEIPKKPESMIRPKPINASYYLDIYCDGNENGLKDTGDLIIDGDKGLPTVAIDIDDPQVFFIKAIQ